jgi:AraC-like DNA-binding protein
LRILAELTNVPEHQLSKLLNAHGGISFNDFINGYRLNEAIVYLEETGKNRKTIDAIAHECGFGSRATFHRVFSKAYAASPNAYRKKMDT